MAKKKSRSVRKRAVVPKKLKKYDFHKVFSALSLVVIIFGIVLILGSNISTTGKASGFGSRASLNYLGLFLILAGLITILMSAESEKPGLEGSVSGSAEVDAQVRLLREGVQAEERSGARSYSLSELKEIIGKASALQVRSDAAQEARRIAEQEAKLEKQFTKAVERSLGSEGYSLETISRIASQVDIDPKFVEEAVTGYNLTRREILHDTNKYGAVPSQRQKLEEARQYVRGRWESREKEFSRYAEVMARAIREGTGQDCYYSIMAPSNPNPDATNKLSIFLYEKKPSSIFQRVCERIGILRFITRTPIAYITNVDSQRVATSKWGGSTHFVDANNIHVECYRPEFLHYCGEIIKGLEGKKFHKDDLPARVDKIVRDYKI